MFDPELILFETFESLLRAWRKYKNVSQAELADKINVSERELRRWECGTHKANIENLSDIAEATGIPMPVLVALNAQQPIYYSVKERRYTFSFIETNGYIRTELLKNVKNNNTLGAFTPIKTLKQINNIIEYNDELYNNSNPLDASIIALAVKLLPDLNFSIKDSFGHYAGHFVTIPIKDSCYAKLRDRILKNGDIKTTDLIHNFNDIPYTLFIFSIYYAHSSYGLILLAKAISALKSLHLPDGVRIAGYNVKLDTLDLCRRFGMQITFQSQEEYKALNTQIVPTMMETYIGEFMTIKEIKEFIR